MNIIYLVLAVCFSASSAFLLVVGLFRLLRVIKRPIGSIGGEFEMLVCLFGTSVIMALTSSWLIAQGGA